MKRRISKRIIAIGISLCVAFSIMPLSVSAEAEAAAPAVKQNNLWVSTGKTFQTLAEIQALCNEILNEVKIIK